MSEFYTDMAATAAELIEEFGQTMTLTRRTAGAYASSTGDATVTTSTASVFGVVLPARKQNRSDDERFQPGSMVREGSHNIILAADGLAVTPLPGDTIATSSETWVVLSVTTLNPAGTALYHSMAVNRG